MKDSILLISDFKPGTLKRNLGPGISVIPNEDIIVSSGYDSLKNSLIRLKGLGEVFENPYELRKKTGIPIPLVQKVTDNQRKQKKQFKTIGVKPEFPYRDGWLGADGTLSVQLSDHRVLWIFSDSYVSGNKNARTRKESTNMIANTIGISSFKGGENDIHYYWRKYGKTQHPFFVSHTSRYKFWPVWGFYRNDTVFVFMQKTGPKENPEAGELFNFKIMGTTLAVITNIAQSDPLRWKVELIPYSSLFPDETWTQAGTDKNYLYVVKNFNRENFLTRIPLNSLLTPSGAVEYLALNNKWKNGCRGDDRKVIFKGQANGSLEFYPDLQYWIYVYGPNFLNNEIMYRFAMEIEGPWSGPRVLLNTPEQTTGTAGYDKRHFCYLARSHASFFNIKQRQLLITYDCNSTDFSHVSVDDSIYVPRVIMINVPRLNE